MGALLGMTGCSGSSAGSAKPGTPLAGTTRSKACAVFPALDATAARVKSGDPKDPVAFAAALDSSVADYLKALDSLRKAVPGSLQTQIDTMKAQVESHDFVAAAKSRAPLDAWSGDNC